MSVRFEVERSPCYRTIVVSGVFGGHRPGFFEAIVYTDELMADRALESQPPDSSKVAVKRTIQCRLLMNPFQAKALLMWLKEHVEAYERKFGEIKLPEKPRRAEGPGYMAV